MQIWFALGLNPMVVPTLSRGTHRFAFETLPLLISRLAKSNSNSLANQLDIHLILAKHEKLASNSLANQLGKNENLAKLTSSRAYMRARIVLAIDVSL
jgi:hypothetical protein